MDDTIQATRTKYNLLIGQLIEQTLGLSAVREIFEAAENGDGDAVARIEAAKATGKAPSGFLALDMGLIDTETKEALLTAQAAERTLLTIEEMEAFHQDHMPIIKEITETPSLMDDSEFNTNFYSPFNKAVELYLDDNAPISDAANTNNRAFQYIGTKGESDMLVLAQATHQLVTEYYRNERMGNIQKTVQNPLTIGNMQPLGMGYLDGFKKQAQASYKEAATVLASKGYDNVAADIDDVVGAIKYDAANATRHTPKDFAETANWLQHRLADKENNTYFQGVPRGVVVHADWNNTMTIYARRALGLTG